MQFTIVTVAGVLMALTPPADAAAKLASPTHPTEATAPRDAGEPIMAIVSIKSQQVTIYDADGWILRAPVSTGIKGRETPAGVFSVVEKDKDHHSNLYDDAWMPNMERITWSGIALHGGPLPGYAASHGCIRMPYDFAENLFGRDADRHARDHRAGRCGAGRVFRSEAVRAERGCACGRAGARRNARRARRPTPPRRPTKPRSRRNRSGARGGGARLRPCASWKCSRLAPTPSSPSPKKCSPPPRPTRTRRAPRTSGRRPPPRPRTSARSSKPPRPTPRRSSTRPRRRRTPLKAAEAKRTETAAGGARRKTRARAGLGLHQPQDQEALCAARLQPTIEIPITIRDPDKPIGTHIFTAVARTDTGLRWTAVTIDDGDDAKNALDRITIPAGRA